MTLSRTLEPMPSHECYTGITLLHRRYLTTARTAGWTGYRTVARCYTFTGSADTRGANGRTGADLPRGQLSWLVRIGLLLLDVNWRRVAVVVVVSIRRE